MSDRIALQPLEPGLDALDDAWFDVLREAVQPNSKIPTDNAVQQLLDILPGDNLVNEVHTFLQTCFDIADQIPYDHASQSKLVTLIDLVLNSPKIAQPIDDSVGGADRRARYTTLAQTLGDWRSSSKPSEGANKYVNFHTFAARVYQRGMLSGTSVVTRVCEDALGEPEKVSSNELDAYVLAAAQSILIIGNMIYRDVLQNGKSGSPTIKQWRKWREELQAAASEERTKTYSGLQQETRLLAARAAEEMRSIELKSSA